MRPGFSLVGLPEAERAGVVRLCQLVEGLPLALEMAAAWTRTLSCAAIAGELEQRLDLLASSARDVPARQGSLLAVFEHAWLRLAPAEQDVLCRLSVMRGSFSLAAAEAVAGASLPTLARLADQAVLKATDGDRYHLHELLRQFAAERLSEHAETAQAAHAAHARYFAAFIASRRARIDSAQQPMLFAEIDPDFENVRAAWERLAADGEWDRLRAMTYVVFNYLDLRGRYADAQQFWTAAYERLRHGPPGAERDLALAEVSVMLGWTLVRRGIPQQAREAFTLAHDQYERYDAAPSAGMGTEPHAGLSVVAGVEGDFAEAARQAETALRLSELRDDRHNRCMALYALSGAALGQALYAEARQWAEQALSLATALDVPWFAAYCHNSLGQIARAERDYPSAQEHFRASEAIRRELDDPEGKAVALRELGAVIELQGQHAQARELLEASLALYRQIGDRGGLAAALTWLGRVALAQARTDEARGHFAEALRIASDAHYVPVMVAALAGVGEWLWAAGRAGPGRRWLRYVLAHPACDSETRDGVERRLGQARKPSEQVEGEIETIEAAVEAALADLAMPSPQPSLVPAHGQSPLNARELEVLRLVADGLSNREIAQRLIMSPGTIKWYTSQIYSKLQVRGRTQALARACELGLLT
jgi:ATP/maltotriose-dependent transcriptional regulator MalT